jgi:hypothetical protein
VVAREGCAGVAGSAGCVGGCVVGWGDAAGAAGGVTGGVVGDAGVAGSAVGVAAAGDAVGAAAGCAEGEGVAGGSGAEPLIAVANAVRLARAVVSLAFVSSSRVTAALAFAGEVPVVPVGFEALAALVADVSASSSPRILSAAAASFAHFDPLFASAFSVVAPVGAAAALDGLFAVSFSSAFTRFFSSAICVFALPLAAVGEMLFNAAPARSRCS